MLGGPCSQQVTGNPLQLSRPQSGMIEHTMPLLQSFESTVLWGMVTE